MKFRMEAALRFWVDCSYEDKKYENPNRTRAELIAEILREYERHGPAGGLAPTSGEVVTQFQSDRYRPPDLLHAHRR